MLVLKIRNQIIQRLSEDITLEEIDILRWQMASIRGVDVSDVYIDIEKASDDLDLSDYDVDNKGDIFKWDNIIDTIDGVKCTAISSDELLDAINSGNVEDYLELSY